MVSTGRHHRAIPGPSIMPERVLRAMHPSAPNIPQGELISLAESLYRDLNGLAGNSGDVLIYIGNGHATHHLHGLREALDMLMEEGRG